MAKYIFFVLLVIGSINSLFSNTNTNNGINDEVVYGEDDRVEVVNAINPMHRHLAYSTASLIPNFFLNLENDVYTIKGAVPTLNTKISMCKDEKFIEQAAIADCSGFLVAPDIIATAGHCVDDSTACRTKKWVFEYWADADGNSPESIPRSNVYGCKEVIAQVYEFSVYKDYALVKLDRPVTDREPLKVRTEGKVDDNQSLFVIGNPVGLPTKVAGNARITKNKKNRMFFATLDTFGGNSGSPVFNSATGVVEGILVRGAPDFSYDRESRCHRVNYIDEDRRPKGEGVTRITEVDPLMDLLSPSRRNREGSRRRYFFFDFD